MEKKFFAILVLAMVAMFAFACSNPPATETGPVAVSGAMQKGPLLKGSDLTVSMLDATGAPTGLSYATVTEDDLGTFNVVAQTTGPCELVGHGFYYNEIADKLSGASITLRAVYEILEGDPQEAYLNVFTHMSSGLAKKRLSEGDTVEEAVVYAENLLFTELGIIHPLGALQGNGTDMDLTEPSSPDNQYIMALSCIVAKAAELRAEDASEVDARLQELVNDIRSQMQVSGAINPEYKEYLRAGESALDPIDDCVANLADYLYAKTGEVVDLPDPNQCADNDHDGTVNAEDLDIDGDSIENADDEAPYNASVGGGMYFDSETGLVWEQFPNFVMISWSAAQSYCEDLVIYGHDDWRMPTISELRTLIRGCPYTESGGYCAVTDECSEISCDNGVCWSGYCPQGSGPAGPDNCYWQDDLGGECKYAGYWSSTLTQENNPWIIGFYSSVINWVYVDSAHFVRCVRSL
jgi:hypothetical protein